jgi:hypothetical protein
MPSAHPAYHVIYSSDDDHSDTPLMNGLSSAKRARTVSSPMVDKPNVWKRCPLPPRGDQIRLLKLYPPGKRSENVLEANLVVREGNEPYEALSYTWGSAGDTGSIRVWSGSGEFEEIEIQANLESALRQLRRKHRTRTLWIDAVCVDLLYLRHVYNLVTAVIEMG